MSRRLLVLAMLFCAVVFAPPAFACRCLPQPGYEQAVGRAEVAFVGQVTRELGDDRYEARVDSVVKGSLPRTVTVRAEGDSTCSGGVPAAVPFAYAGGRDLVVRGCSHEVWTGEYAVRSASGLPTYAPTAAPRNRLVPVALAVGVVAAVAFAAVTSRRRRRLVPPAP